MPDNFVPLYQRVSTSLARRRPTELSIQQMVERVEEQGQGAVSVVCLDIDGYSEIERAYGYVTADALLDSIVAYIEDHPAPRVSLFVRYVRDSFLAVYDGLTLEEAFLAGEGLRRMLSGMSFTASDGHRRVQIPVKFSAGVATYPGDPEDHVALISMAEQAARRAHESGGDRIMLGRAVQMQTKTSHYSPDQLEGLRKLRERLGRTEASLLREALDDLLRKYGDRDTYRETALVDET